MIIWTSSLEESSWLQTAQAALAFAWLLNKSIKYLLSCALIALFTVKYLLKKNRFATMVTLNIPYYESLLGFIVSRIINEFINMTFLCYISLSTSIKIFITKLSQYYNKITLNIQECLVIIKYVSAERKMSSHYSSQSWSLTVTRNFATQNRCHERCASTYHDAVEEENN